VAVQWPDALPALPAEVTIGGVEVAASS